MFYRSLLGWIINSQDKFIKNGDYVLASSFSTLNFFNLVDVKPSRIEEECLRPIPGVFRCPSTRLPRIIPLGVQQQQQQQLHKRGPVWVFLWTQFWPAGANVWQLGIRGTIGQMGESKFCQALLSNKLLRSDWSYQESNRSHDWDNMERKQRTPS